MAAKDYDEYCDPANPKPVNYEDIEEAAKKLSKHIHPTPCQAAFCAKRFMMTLTYKLENVQRTGSFKDRGCLNALLNLPEEKKNQGVAVGTLGNEGYAMSYFCKELKIRLLVVMPTWMPIHYRAKCESWGAKVTLSGTSLQDAMERAHILAKQWKMTYINGRDHPDVLTGNGTVALEILKQVPDVDAILVPVGTGGLMAAVSTVIKANKPGCLIYGVQPEAASLLFKKLKSGSHLKVDNRPTLAESIAVTALEVNSLPSAMNNVNKMLVVRERWIARAMLHMSEKQHLVVEGAAACPLAALIGGLVPELRSKNVVAIITGGNVNSFYFSRYLELGLAAEGRIVKFSVVTMDNNKSLLHLLELLAKGEWDVLYQSQVHRQVATTNLNFEINLVCRTKDLEHALTLRRLIKKEYPDNCVFHHELFTDSRTCECYVFKGITADKRPNKKPDKPDDPEIPDTPDGISKKTDSAKDLMLPGAHGFCLSVNKYSKLCQISSTGASYQSKRKELKQ